MPTDNPTAKETLNGVEIEIWPTWYVGWGGVIHPAIKIERDTVWKGSGRFNTIAAAEAEARKYLTERRSKLIEEWQKKLCANPLNRSLSSEQS